MTRTRGLKGFFFLLFAVFNPSVFEKRLDNISEKIKTLQKETENYLKKATMDGEQYWFLNKSEENIDTSID